MIVIVIVVIILMIMVWLRINNGVSTKGVTVIVMYFDRGTFRVLPLTYFDLPRSVKSHHLCSGPISVEPICPQPTYEQPYYIISMVILLLVLSLSNLLLHCIITKAWRSAPPGRSAPPLSAKRGETGSDNKIIEQTTTLE